MEVVAAVASFVAIGQALAAIPKIIDVLRSIVKVRREVLELLNEVELLDGLGAAVTEIIQRQSNNDNPTAGIPMRLLSVLKTVETDLVSVVSELKKLTSEFQPGKDKNGQIKIDKVKWFRYKMKIASLSKRAKKNREYLHEIIACTSSFATTSNGMILVDILNIVTTQVQSRTPPPTQLQCLSQGHLIEQAISYTAEDENLKGIAGDDGTGRPSPTITAEDSSEALYKEGGDEELEPLMLIKATMRRTCTRDCACQCHFLATRKQPHPATSAIYGWLKQAYSSFSQFNTSNCDILTCRRTRSPVHINLRFPLLFCSRALEARLRFGSVVGTGASLHLRVARPLETDDNIWFDIKNGKIERICRAICRREVSPFDGDLKCNIMEYSIDTLQFDVLLILLEESASVLRSTDVARRLAARVRLVLFMEDFDQKETNILQKAIAFDEDTEDCWPIHEAVRGSGNLAAILEESSEGINATDEFGQAPLHWAVAYQNIDAIQLLIDYGANLNIRDASNDTPLMHSAVNGDSSCTQALIDGGCDVNIARPDGWTALLHAIFSNKEGSAEVASLLLKHGARLTCDINMQTALHLLAYNTKAAEIPDKFQLLVHAGAKLEPKDDSGNTPLIDAVNHNNSTMIHLLLDAGCKFEEAPNWLNSLHSTARYASAETIDFLSKDHFTVDVRVRDSNGDTPLDVLEWRIATEPSWLPGSFLPPSKDEVAAYKKLLGDVRDRYLNAEIRTLETVLGHLKSHDSILAREVLQSVIQEKVHWNIPSEHRTFRTIDVQIREEMMEAAIESLEEFIEVSSARIGTDPFVGDYCRRSGLEDRGLVVEEIN